MPVRQGLSTDRIGLVLRYCRGIPLRSDRFITRNEPLVAHHLNQFAGGRVRALTADRNRLVDLSQGTRTVFLEQMEYFQFHFCRLIGRPSRFDRTLSWTFCLKTFAKLYDERISLKVSWIMMNKFVPSRDFHCYGDSWRRTAASSRSSQAFAPPPRLRSSRSNTCTRQKLAVRCRSDKKIKKPR